MPSLLEVSDILPSLVLFVSIISAVVSGRRGIHRIFVLSTDIIENSSEENNSQEPGAPTTSLRRIILVKEFGNDRLIYVAQTGNGSYIFPKSEMFRISPKLSGRKCCIVVTLVTVGAR